MHSRRRWVCCTADHRQDKAGLRALTRASLTVDTLLRNHPHFITTERGFLLQTLYFWECEIAEILGRACEAQQFNAAAAIRPVLDQARIKALTLGDDASAYLLSIAEHLSEQAATNTYGEQNREYLKQIARIFATASRGAGPLGS
jgi:hypothetical protein